MRAVRAAGRGVIAVVLGLTLSSATASAELLLETATLGPNPQPAVGIGGIQWIGARFSVSSLTFVDQVGANIEGVSTIFVAIVPLSGPGGLPSFAPADIEANALAATTMSPTLNVADVSVPLSVKLLPGDYGVVFGVGAFGAGGAANLTGGNVPTSQSSFFSADLFNTFSWIDQPTFSGLRVFVTGTRAIPEPASVLLAGLGALGLLVVARRARASAPPRAA